VRHPFDLELQDLENLGVDNQDLEFEEAISSAEAEAIAGGRFATTRALGEEGGGMTPKPRRRPRPAAKKPIDLPIFTTMALGEEGGAMPPEATTLAIGEEGGLSSEFIG